MSGYRYKLPEAVTFSTLPAFLLFLSLSEVSSFSDALNLSFSTIRILSKRRTLKEKGTKRIIMISLRFGKIDND